MLTDIIILKIIFIISIESKGQLPPPRCPNQMLYFLQFYFWHFLLREIK